MLSVNLTFVGHASWEEIKEVQSWTPCGLTFKEVDLWKDQQIWYLRVTFQAHEITTVFSLKFSAKRYKNVLNRA